MLGLDQMAKIAGMILIKNRSTVRITIVGSLRT